MTPLIEDYRDTPILSMISNLAFDLSKWATGLHFSNVLLALKKKKEGIYKLKITKELYG